MPFFFVFCFFCTLVRLRGIVTELLPIQNMSQLCSPSLGAILLSINTKDSSPYVRVWPTNPLINGYVTQFASRNPPGTSPVFVEAIWVGLCALFTGRQFNGKTLKLLKEMVKH